METIIKIGKLKAGDHFEMDGRQYIITHGGHGYPDVEFKLQGGKDTLTTSNKNLYVRLISSKQQTTHPINFKHMQHTTTMPARNRPKVNVLTSQRQRLIDHLKASRSIHFLQAMQMDIPLLTDRIRELQGQGMTIQTKTIRIGRISCAEYSLQPSIRWHPLPADEYSQNRFQVNDEWIIECIPTVFGNTRVCLRQKDDITLICNWCAGNRESDVEYLFNVMLGYLEAGNTDLMPMCSREKPYYQDEAFKAMIKPYHRQYVSFIVQIDTGISQANTYTVSKHSASSYTS